MKKRKFAAKSLGTIRAQSYNFPLTINILNLNLGPNYAHKRCNQCSLF